MCYVLDMSEAEAILWFAMMALFSGGACYVVRGLIGEDVRIARRAARPPSDGDIEEGARIPRRRITRSLVALGVGLCLLGAGSSWGALTVRRWFSWSSGGSADRLALVVASGMLLPCVVLLGIGIVGDRAKGGKRCPGCWYDMSAGGDRCPECGRDITGPSDLVRTRRRRWPFVMAAVLVLGAVYAWRHTARIHRAGWLGGVPTTALSLGWKWLPDTLIVDQRVDGSLSNRIQFERAEPVGLWASTTRALSNPRSLDLLPRAMQLRDDIASVRAESMAVWSEADFALPPDGAERLGTFILGYRPANQRETQMLDALVWGRGFTAPAITAEQRDEILERVANGQAVDGVALSLAVRTVWGSIGPEPDSGERLETDLALRAIEHHPFPIRDARRGMLAWFAVAAARADPDAIPRLHDLTEHPSPSVRLTALNGLVNDTGWEQDLSIRLRSALGNAVRDPVPEISAYAAQVLMSRRTHDEDGIRAIVEAIRSNRPGREGLIPSGPSNAQIPLAIEEAVVDAIADPDPVMAERAAEYLRFRLYEHDPVALSLAARTRDLLDAGALSDPAFSQIRGDLSFAINSAVQRTTQSPQTPAP